jgi:hypothetical protein
MQMTEYLNFLDTVIRLDADAQAQPALAGVRRFFRHLLAPEPAGPVTFRIDVHAYRPELDVEPSVWELEETVIRRSSAAEFSFDAHVVEHATRRTYVNRSVLLDAPRDARSDSAFALRLTEAGTVQVIDFLRDLVIRHQESCGTVVLHASAVTDGTSAVVVAGPKGAGKTTTLLSVLRRPEWSYFTGDKLFCRPLPGGGVMAYPWRDYPYIGVGTILADPRLAGTVRDTVAPDLDRLAPTHKLLLDPDVFEDWLGTPFSAQPRPIAALLLPRVLPGRPMRSRRIDDANERWSLLNQIIDRQADTTFFGWQSYLVPDYTAFFAALARMPQQLAGVPMISLTGTLDVDAGALLKEHAGAAGPGRP